MYLFNAKIENPEKLEKMLVGRKQVVDTLVDAQLEHSKGGMPPQFLVVGPRGSGKTHILRIIYDRLSRNADFMATHEIAYMVEDETGIGSYFDLLQRIFQALKRWSNDEQKKRFIVEEVEKLKDVHPNTWAKTAESILLNILNGKSLLVLIENFDAILKGIDKKAEVVELAKLRDFIQQHNQLSFIATSQSLINSLSNNQNPLYGFFHTIHLKRLTLEESFEYVKKIAQAENNDELVQFLETHAGRGHLEAIHQFTKGNHRLLLVFFDFLKAEFRSNLSEVFLKSIDELKPYYEGFLRNLAPQQQKIVQYLCLQRNPQKGADISRNCFLEKTTVSKQLSDLQLLGYVSAVNEKGRDKYYEINEPLLRMCIEINEDRDGIIKLFVNFLGQLYTSEQLKEKYLHYKYLERFQPEPIRKLYQSESKIYEMVKSQFLSCWALTDDDESRLNMCNEPEEAKNVIQSLSQIEDVDGDLLLQIREFLDRENYQKAIEVVQKNIKHYPSDPSLNSVLGYCYGRTGQYEKAINAFKVAAEISPDDDINWYNLGLTYNKVHEYEKAIIAFQRAIEIKPNNPVALFGLGNSYSSIHENEKSIQAFREAAKIDPVNERIWYNLGNSYISVHEYGKAISAYQSAAGLNPNDEMIWNNLGIVYSEIKEYEKAIDVYQKAIEINPNQDDIWHNLGISYGRIGKYEEAISAFQKAAEINSNDEIIWYNLGISYYKIKKYRKAESTFNKVLEINPNNKNAWDDLGGVLGKIEEYERAIVACKKALEIDPNFGNAWNNLGVCYFDTRKYREAKDAYSKAIKKLRDEDYESHSVYYSNLIEVNIVLKEINEALSSIEELFSKPERLVFISKLEDGIVLLCTENSEDAIKAVWNKLLQICETNQATEKLSALLSNVVFRILKEYQEIKPFKIELLQHILDELFGDKPEFTYPLKYLNIGIRCFLKGEKEAIYEMSQEERLIFEKFTSSESKE